jgi:hypothetical protein
MQDTRTGLYSHQQQRQQHQQHQQLKGYYVYDGIPGRSGYGGGDAGAGGSVQLFHVSAAAVPGKPAKQSRGPCKFGSSCTRSDCWFDHAKDSNANDAIADDILVSAGLNLHLGD